MFLFAASSNPETVKTLKAVFESLRTAAKTYSQVSIVALLILSPGEEAQEQRLKLAEIVALLKARKLGSVY